MILLWLVFIFFFILFVSKFIYKFQHGKVKSLCRLDGKVVIVTGANTGIGLETSRDLARRGARVILACRNMEKAQHAAADIRNTTGNDKIEVKLLDTSSLASVRSFANDILSSEKELHILINNAGMAGATDLRYTEDGLELTMATNHYGHFLLTNMLAPLLKASAPSRILYVSSLLHKLANKLDPDDLNFHRTKFSGWNAYNQSKLCNVLTAAEAGRRLSGTGVTTYSLHPGVVNSEIFTKSSSLLLVPIAWLVAFTGKDTVSGAQTSIHCAVDESAGNETGLYYTDCKPVSCSRIGRDVALSSKLWMASELDVKLTKNEANI